MNAKTLPSPTCGRILLLVSPSTTLGPLFEMVARTALQGPLYVVDGGNTFQGYPLARTLRRYTSDFGAVLKRVTLSRVFTCYQMETLLAGETFATAPVLVLDFLATFYDQGVRVADRRRLLQICLRRLADLGRRVPVAVWVRQRSVVPEEALSFLEMVQRSAGQVWTPERLPEPAPRQLALL